MWESLYLQIDRHSLCLLQFEKSTLIKLLTFPFSCSFSKHTLFEVCDSVVSRANRGKEDGFFCYNLHKWGSGAMLQI